MNGTTKFGVITAVAVVAVGGWFGRAAWRAHQGLVTLHVRNAPLAEVVQSIENQTREKILFDKKLAGRISLNVEDVPLARALDLVAARAGARWQKTFAVGRSPQAWRALEGNLRGETAWPDAGWTNVAPQFEDAPMPAMNMPAMTSDGGSGSPSPEAMGQMMRTMTSMNGGGHGGATTMTFSSDGKVDHWSPERLALETALNPSSGLSTPPEATAEGAAQTATAVHGEARVYYALEKSPFGMGGMGGMASGSKHMMRMMPGGPGGKGGENGGPPPDIGATIMAAQRARRLQELANSPEAQVEQARDRASRKTHVQNFEITK